MTDTPDQPAEIPGVQPALSEKEWGEQLAHDVGFSRTSGHGEIAAHVYVTLANATDGGLPDGVTEALEIHWNNAARSTQIWDRHKLGALCLYGTPEGFTQEDVDFLEEQRRALMTSSYGRGKGSPIEQRLASLADRIAALLPPKP